MAAFFEFKIQTSASCLVFNVLQTLKFYITFKDVLISFIELLTSLIVSEIAKISVSVPSIPGAVLGVVTYTYYKIQLFR